MEALDKRREIGGRPCRLEKVRLCFGEKGPRRCVPPEQAIDAAIERYKNDDSSE